MKAAGSLEPSTPVLLAWHWTFPGLEHRPQNTGLRTGTLHFSIRGAITKVENSR